MKTILLFQHSLCESNRNMFSGIYQYAQKTGWRIQTIQYALAARVRRTKENPEIVNVPSLIDFWKADGCIVEGQDDLTGKPTPGDFGKTPVVFLDRAPQSLPKRAFCVYSNSAAVANAAARELLSLGLESFAYVDWWKEEAWSRQRGLTFEETLMTHGKRCQRLSMPSFEDRPSDDFKRSIESLPRPCGVFCANDLAAYRFITEARRLELEVPEDFAVIGVDNDMELCETSPVSMSSIPQDCVGAGILAAELLDHAMSHHPPAARKVTFGVLPVARRASTRLLRRKDPRISAALEYIRQNACSIDIDVSAVVDVAKCSRRQLDSLFRRIVRHSVLDEIHARRIECAIRLLRQKGLDISKIASRCGYRSASDFSRAFKRSTGTAPSKYGSPGK